MNTQVHENMVYEDHGAEENQGNEGAQNNQGNDGAEKNQGNEGAEKNQGDDHYQGDSGNQGDDEYQGDWGNQGDEDNQGEETDVDNDDGDEDSESEEWHSDASNQDDDEDELLFDDGRGADIQYDQGEEGNKSEASSEYVPSEDERMAGNSTDGSDVEKEFPMYKDNGGSPVFELGLCFVNAKSFRDAVKRHAVFERRPIENCRGFGKKIQYKCQEPCKWKIYANTVGESSTYQIRTLRGEHTCMPTYKQKQMNSRWLADWYEQELRMNPSWPIDSFHKKIVNDFKCNVSKLAN